jgi:hypothetical protein
VVQTCYQTVPVTEYQQVKQVVKRPVYETAYVDQPVTAYRPVVETKTAEVPTISYQNVTEYQTVQRDCGQWITQCTPNCRLSPCEYDNRPGFTAWLNRTGYSLRSAFTPQYKVSRHYVPNIVAQSVPVTRQVAIRGTQQVTYNVTRMEAYQTTRQVAVNTVKYVDHEVVAMRPVTVMRTVPIGSRVAYTFGPVIGGPSQTALQPVPDPLGAGQSPSRTAVSPDKFERESTNAPRETAPTRRSSHEVPADDSNVDESPFPQARSADEATEPASQPRAAVSAPSVVRVKRWTATRPHVPAAVSAGPTLAPPAVSVAGSAG